MLSLAIDNTNPNSRAAQTRANTAGDVLLLPVVAGAHSNLQAFSMPAEPTGEGFPTRLQPSPVIDSNSTGATVEAEMIASQAVSASPSTRPASFDGSGDEPSVPSFADGGAKMRGSLRCSAGRADTASGVSNAQAKQVATYSTWSPWSVCKGSI